MLGYCDFGVTVVRVFLLSFAPKIDNETLNEPSKSEASRNTWGGWNLEFYNNETLNLDMLRRQLSCCLEIPNITNFYQEVSLNLCRDKWF